MHHFDFSNEKEVESLFRLQYSDLVHFASKYISDFDKSEEIVQDVFYKLLKKGENIEIQSSIQSYLFGSVRNACLNQLKHQKVQLKYETTAKLWTDSTNHHQPLEIEELQERIKEAMKKIPPKCLEIFLLSREEGKKYHQIADILDISIKTVENQMSKALKILRAELREYLPIVLLSILLL